MIRIFTALYCEAQPLIKYYHLKKNNNINKFQVFQNDNILLLITNTGSIAAAVGVSFLSTLYPPSPSDFLINIGICGARDHNITVGSIFLCNKITEESTNRSFYPDVIFKHSFAESDLITCSNVQQDSDFNGNRDELLFDMEAAAIYQAAAYYFKPHQISILKIVSDHGITKMPGPDEVSGLIEKNMPDITEWLEKMQQIIFEDKAVFTLEEETSIKSMVNNLQCSVTMEFKLRQLLQYYKLIHGSFIEVIEDFCLNSKLPCKTKLEGKMYFEQLKSRLV